MLATLARCTIEPRTLTDAEVRVDNLALGTTLPGDLWLYATDGWLQWPGGLELTAPAPQAGITFAVPKFCHRHGCSLVIEGSAPADLVATVDGVPAAWATRTDGAVTVPVPPRRPADTVWVTLTRTSGETLGMRLTGLRLERGAGVDATRGQA